MTDLSPSFWTVTRYSMHRKKNSYNMTFLHLMYKENLFTKIHLFVTIMKDYYKLGGRFIDEQQEYF
jgi:hypothetical protein